MLIFGIFCIILIVNYKFINYEKTLLLTFSALLALTSCNEKIEITEATTSNEISFSSQIGASSKVSGSFFESGDEITVLGTLSSGETQTATYTYSESSFTSTEPITKESEDEAIAFKATYPCISDISAPFDFAISTNQSGDGYELSDLLVANIEATASLQPTLTFSHKLTNLVMIFKLSDGTAIIPSSVEVSALSNVQCDIEADTYSATGEVAAINAVVSGTTGYKAIIAPQTIAEGANFISASYGEVTYSGQFPCDAELVSGSQYTFGIVLNEKSGTVTSVELIETTVDDWLNEEMPEDEPEDDFVYSGVNYIKLNYDSLSVSLTSNVTYTPTQLAADHFNYLDVSIDPQYTVYINGEEYKNGLKQKFYVDEISSDAKILITYVNNESGSTTATTTINTLPSGITTGPVVTNNPDPGYYYSAYGTYIFKMDTQGSLVFYKYVSGGSYFNRVEIDGVVYYSYLSTSSSSISSSGTGYAHKKAVIMNDDYEEIDTVECVIGNDDVQTGMPLENHQFNVLGEKHYLVGAYVPLTVKNIPSSVSSSSSGTKVLAAFVQEIKDGVVEFEWLSTDYEELYAYNTSANYTSYSANSNSYLDYIHINSSVIDPYDGNVMMSFRAISTILKVNKSTGEIMWRLCGAGDDFNLTSDQTFVGQHDIKITGEGEFTIFNNGATSPYGSSSLNSSAMKFNLDEVNLKVNSYERYNKSGTLTYAEGSAQELATGRYVMGWGRTSSSTYLFSEEDFLTGETLFGWGWGSSDSVYKAFKYDK